jgi:hypothetical protein
MDYRSSNRLAQKPRLDYNTMQERTEPSVETQKRSRNVVEDESPPTFHYCPVLLVNFIVVFMITIAFVDYTVSKYPLVHYITPAH